MTQHIIRISIGLIFIIDINIKYENNWYLYIHHEIQGQVLKCEFTIQDLTLKLLLERDQFGTLSLARRELPIRDCLMSSDLDINYQLADYRSVPLLKFKANTSSVKNGDIELRLVSSGLDKPKKEYPNKAEVSTAGEWNSIALHNNRIAISVSNKSIAQVN